MIIAIRHGHTAFNEDGQERLRGWLSIPLSLQGMKEMHETAESIAAVEDIKKIYTSDLVRAVQSAEEVGQALSMEIEPHEELRDWNYGYLTGQFTNAATHKALKDFMENPTKVPKDGESFKTFLDRAVPFLDKVVTSDDLFVIISHNRICTLLAAIAKTSGDHPDTPTLEKPGPIDPGGIMLIRSDWSISFMTAKDKVDKPT